MSFQTGSGWNDRLSLGDGVVPASSVAWMFLESLHLEDPFAFVLDSEVDQPPEVDGGDPQRQSELVSRHSSEPDPPMIVGHQPGDGSFHHRSPAAVVLSEVTLSPCSTGFEL